MSACGRISSNVFNLFLISLLLSDVDLLILFNLLFFKSGGSFNSILKPILFAFLARIVPTAPYPTIAIFLPLKSTLSFDIIFRIAVIT